MQLSYQRVQMNEMRNNENHIYIANHDTGIHKIRARVIQLGRERTVTQQREMRPRGITPYLAVIAANLFSTVNNTE
uniref:Prophage protein n=1 Tax=Heterorhabditis bacteriophora TaxID=37862 RepID=A0A1I7WJ98_HETBA